MVQGRSSFEFRKLNPVFAWHPKFHDHIIHNAKAFANITSYIENNPAKWKK
jgi:putative transposase